MFACELADPLADVFNSSLKEGVVPTQWKEAVVAPIPKELPAVVDKLRPISLTAIFAKICEGLVAKWVTSDVWTNIDRRQFGAIKRSSTTHCLVSLTHFLYQGAEASGNMGRIVLTDFTKAFDTVSHQRAICRLLSMGTRASVIPWIVSFLTERRQKVRYGSALSDWETLTSGVPQGTKLGPVIFVCMINDASQSHDDRWKYVDDLTLGENRSVRKQSHLQDQVDSLEVWSNTAQLKLNPKKCMVLTVCFMKSPPPPPPITLGGKPLLAVVVAKVLGIWLQSNLKWDKQVCESTKKANKRMFMLRRLKTFGLSTPDLVTVYCGYIRPILEYCAPVYHHSLTNKQTITLENVQRRACRIILGRHYHDYATSLQQCGLETLKERRNNLCRRFATSMEKSERTVDLLPPTRLASHGRNLRNSKTLSLPTTRTSRFSNSPVPSLLRILNETK
ncbi:Hypp1820 [Branchiostoma lanceolatum]|uniref:Hypp1820 protein n=1 Tax=Branchiostoma lanceolatum TaxID=7740 RepID=A0A8K0EPY6_BRALA|nr:Hypp1820 [Branchiostoma lanceolatum]